MSLGAGVLIALSFPLGPPLPLPNTDGWWPAAWICLAPLMLAGAGARRAITAAGLGLLAGLVGFGAILAWIEPFLVRWARLSALEALGVSSLLIIYMALYPAAFCACVNLWSRRFGPIVAFLLAPAAWCGLELVRGTFLSGFPWCLLGSSQQPAPAVVQVADLCGVYGISFVLAAASGAAACMASRSLRRGTPGATPAWAAAMLLTCLVLSALGYGRWRLNANPGVEPTLPVALVQANVAQADKWNPDETGRIEEVHFQMTHEAAARGARMVVWSESSVPISITHHPDYARRLASLADVTQADLVVGTVSYENRDGADAPFNSAVMLQPGQGIVGRYDKMHLVPFGEYVPLRRFLYFLSPLVAEASAFQPGRSISVLRGNGPAIGPIICYEAIFPRFTREYARTGAEVIVNITNDAWYGDTAMPRQHLMQTALRAVESRRWLLRCAGTGISAVVDPAGRIVARSRFERKEVLEAKIAPLTGLTVYASAGDVFAISCVILSLAALALAGVVPARKSQGAATTR